MAEVVCADCNEENCLCSVVGCVYVFVSGKNIGKFCDKRILEDRLCKTHLNKKKKEQEKENLKKEGKCPTETDGKFCGKELLEKSKFCEEHTGKCRNCEKILIQGNHENNRKICNSCRNKDAASKASLIGKTCEDCKGVYPQVKFNSVFRGPCNSCRGIRAKKTISSTKEEYLKSHPKESRECLICAEEKALTSFSWHTNNFRNQCKDCLSECRHYITYRLRKILENEEEYKKHNNEMHKKWYEKNKERVDAYMDVFRNTQEGIVTVYLTSAKAKNLFVISEENFKAMIRGLINQDCFYCGRKAKEGSLQELLAGDYNGVDRINSREPYTEENCVPCCKVCNVIKNTLDVGSFLRKCVEISLNNELNDGIDIHFDNRLKCHTEYNLVGNSAIYSDYKYKAKPRKKVFEITVNNFKDIVKNPCYLCGKSNSNGIGIDRFDNDVGYILENCKPCCSYCNFMKKGIDYQEFLEKVKSIVNHSVSDKHRELCDDSVLTSALHLERYLEENEDDKIDIFDYIN